MDNITRRDFFGAAGTLAAALGLAACSSGSSSGTTTTTSDPVGAGSDLIEAAQAEGSISVLGSCGEEYLKAAAAHFNELYNIKVDYKHLATGEAQSLIESEAGAPTYDIWFGGTTDPYNIVSDEKLFDSSYLPKNSSHLMSESYMSSNNDWFGIYKGLLGIMYNKEELERLGADAPKDWPDLLSDSYKGLIWTANYETSGTARLFLNTIVQLYGHDQGMQYLTQLDKNVQVYTKVGAMPVKNLGTGECVIAVGFLHDGIAQIEDNHYENIELVQPTSGVSYEIGATAALKGCAHPNTAKLWLEYALSPECVELGAKNGSYQNLVIDNATQPSQVSKHKLNPDNVMDYDFENAKEHTTAYVQEIMGIIGGTDSRFER